MNWPLFFSTYALIFVAELPDKTAFATLLLASRGRAAGVFIGVAIAFLVQTIVATCFGTVVSLAPHAWVHLASAVMFLGFAAYLLWAKDDEEEDDDHGAHHADRKLIAVIWSSFLVIFIAEWGDLTQIATMSLVAKYKDDIPSVFLASILALWSVTGVAVLLGERVAKVVSPATLRKVSIVLFSAIGIYFLFTWRSAVPT